MVIEWLGLVEFERAVLLCMSEACTLRFHMRYHMFVRSVYLKIEAEALCYLNRGLTLSVILFMFQKMNSMA